MNVSNDDDAKKPNRGHSPPPSQDFLDLRPLWRVLYFRYTEQQQQELLNLPTYMDVYGKIALISCLLGTWASSGFWLLCLSDR